MHQHAAPVFAPSLPHRLWRRLPADARRRALARVTGWLVSRPKPGPVCPGLAIAGEFSRASGLGEGARLMATAARAANLPVWTIDLPPLAGGPGGIPMEMPADGTSLPPPHVPLVLHVNGPLLPLALLRLPRSVTRHRPIVGYWAWELPDVPDDWRPAAACVTQVWTPSRFTAAALDPLLPGRVRVVPPPLAEVAPCPSPRDRSGFGLPEAAVIVLVSFNLASSCARKNPFAAIAAFRTAFGDRPDRFLLLKLGHADHAPADHARIAALVAGTANIRLETRCFSPADNQALIACADIVLSLHRAEGFGLVLAEAMLLGKPVVATAWSGSTEFMDDRSAVLIPCRLVPARDDRAVYRGAWAEPDVAEAVAALRRLADDPALRNRIGLAAQRHARTCLTAEPLLRAVEALR
ncbi:MAG TPA: glycosyltransferase family 4 protein [Rhodopila sp.]|uniref:glycosyltransferase family 4 protein n=1 Tax=Rhodopila sp. TaxID=2480087 RepID=UPI002C821822|nr:glycosyltransferase family 4 protein [Rhodopila sp.]HVY17689.1 glycosyltransferase family 4 protein [Rhodopila sp.]